MKKTIQILFILTFGTSLSAQNIKIDSKIQVNSTRLEIIQSDFKYYGYSSLDNKKVDSLIVTISTIGTSSTAIKIDLTEKPRAFVCLYSDVPEYNDKHILNVEFEYYDLELNATDFEIGDRIMGKIKGKSKIIANNSNGYQIEFSGKFSHIIGKLMIKKKAEQNYRIIDNE